MDLAVFRTIDRTRPGLRGPVVARALAEGDGPRDPGCGYGVGPWNPPTGPPQCGPTSVFSDQDRLAAAIRNLGTARQLVLRQDAPVIGRRVHKTHVHQAVINPFDAPIIAAGAPAAETVIAGVFHFRDPAIRLGRRTLNDLELRSCHRLVLRALSALVPPVELGERVLLEKRQKARESAGSILYDLPLGKGEWGVDPTWGKHGVGVVMLLARQAHLLELVVAGQSTC